MATLFRIMGLVALSVIAQCPAQAQVQILPEPAARPLTSAQATECRAVAEVLRERQYAAMDSLLLRVERSPNLSPEALAQTQKIVLETEAALKTAEGHVERFIFAAVPGEPLKKVVGRDEPDVLRKRLDDCLSQAPELRPGLK